jgi:hypothetical protein
MPAPSSQHTPPTIDFTQLTLASLRKYKRVHNLRIKPTLSKAELAEHVRAHFTGENRNLHMQQMMEKEREEWRVIDEFVKTVRMQREQQLQRSEGDLHVATGALSKAKNKAKVASAAAAAKALKKGGKKTRSRKKNKPVVSKGVGKGKSEDEEEGEDDDRSDHYNDINNSSNSP